MFLLIVTIVIMTNPTTALTTTLTTKCNHIKTFEDKIHKKKQKHKQTQNAILQFY